MPFKVVVYSCRALKSVDIVRHAVKSPFYRSCPHSSSKQVLNWKPNSAECLPVKYGRLLPRWPAYISNPACCHGNTVTGLAVNHSHRGFQSDSARCAADKSSNEEESLGHSQGLIHQNIFTIPNLLTSTRILITPYIGHLVLQQDFNYACGLFVFAGLTDLFDGWIARRFPSQTSAFGSFLDPLADKFLVTILYFTLTMAGLIPAPLTFVVIARDVLLVGAGFYVRYISLPKPIRIATFFDGSQASVELKPMLVSKINTALQLSLVALTLAAPVFGYVDHWALQSLWWGTAATTISSGIGYVIYKNDTFKMIKAARQKRKTKL